MDAKEDRDAVKAVTDVTVSVLHQQLNCLPEDVVKDLQGRAGVQDKELGHKQKLSASVVHHSILIQIYNYKEEPRIYLNRPEQHFKGILLFCLLLGVRHYDWCLELLYK